jgi:branched-chain amino acid transport system permease protein
MERPVLDWFTRNEFFLDITLISSLLVMSFFVVFQAGIFCLGNVGFMAVGAYTSALLTLHLGFPIVLGVLCGAVAGGLTGMLFAFMVLRLEGIYLALATFALAEAIIVLIETVGFTGGVQGLVGFPTDTLTWYVLPALVITAIVLQLVQRSHNGRAIRALRVDPVIARGLGIRVRAFKIVALAAAGVLAGLSGALNAHEVGVISPDQYNFTILVLALTYAVIGGVTHWSGALLASLVFGLFHELLRGAGTTAENIGYAVVLVALVLIAPRGLGDPRLARWLRRVFRRSTPVVPEQVPVAR